VKSLDNGHSPEKGLQSAHGRFIVQRPER